MGTVMMGRRAAKIANVKGREDAKRAKTFARIGKKIIMASTAVFCCTAGFIPLGFISYGVVGYNL